MGKLSFFFFFLRDYTVWTILRCINNASECLAQASPNKATAERHVHLCFRNDYRRLWNCTNETVFEQRIAQLICIFYSFLRKSNNSFFAKHLNEIISIPSDQFIQWIYFMDEWPWIAAKFVCVFFFWISTRRFLLCEIFMKASSIVYFTRSDTLQALFMITEMHLEDHILVHLCTLHSYSFSEVQEQERNGVR